MEKFLEVNYFEENRDIIVNNYFGRCKRTNTPYIIVEKVLSNYVLRFDYVSHPSNKFRDIILRVEDKIIDFITSTLNEFKYFEKDNYHCIKGLYFTIDGLSEKEAIFLAKNLYNYYLELIEVANRELKLEKSKGNSI